jgi:DNA-binding SARP family transcriptional activator
MLLVAGNQDSIRQTIRFRSHLLVDLAEFNPSQLELLLQEQLPLAFLASGEITEKLKGMIPRIPKEQLPVIIISDGKVPFPEKDYPGIIALTGSELDKIQLLDGTEIVKKKLGCNEFLWMVVDSDSLSSLEPFIKFWEQTGKIPNFIQVKPGRIAETVRIVASLNSHPKIFGVVRNGKQLLADVSWKDLPSRKTNGYFSFPIGLSGSLPLSPYKAGYQFSPDIILPTPENLRNLKIFNAVPLDPDFGLTDQYIFPKRVRNLRRQNDDEVIPYGIGFVRDKSRGNCAFFSGKAYIDGGLKSRSALKSNFSITAWIKPIKLGANNCILGKGKDFVLKIHQGKLTFTVQGVKDYYSAKTPIPLNRWSFIGLVHTGSENYISFYLNGKLTEKISLLKSYVDSDYTMLIGSNLWEEYFMGYMSEINIWDRELNEDEVRNEYLSGSEAKRSQSSGWFWGLIVVSGISGFYLWRRSIGKKQNETDSKRDLFLSRVQVPIVGIEGNREQICCFGGLKVIDTEQKDVSKKFSPKIKQLFLLILLHSVGGQKGISSKKMTDCLWPGMSPQNAKNIRGTNIQNLKALLLSCSGIKLVFQDKLWLLEFADYYFIDYAFVETCLNTVDATDIEKLEDQFSELSPILKKGTLFQNMSESWIDPYIDRMSNRIIEYGLNLFRLLPEEKHGALLLEVADVISLNDPLNEPALRKKVSILTCQGKLSMAHTVFDNFTKLYFELYQEKYSGDFKSLVTGEPMT